MKEMAYRQLVNLFRAVEAETHERIHVSGEILFAPESFTSDYSEEARTYLVSSNNKAFQPNMGGYSIYGSSKDGIDLLVRLEQYMKDEKGDENGWIVDKCFMSEEDFDIAIEAYAKRRLDGLDVRAGCPCPRCGGMMAQRNALSRYASVDICPKCGTDEALLDLMGKPKKRSEWWIIPQLFASASMPLPAEEEKK